MAACRTHARRLSEETAVVDTVFVGGGTPSRVPADALLAVIGALPLAPGAEVTVECNPEDVDDALIEAYAAGGVSRVSIGVQSTVSRTLDLLGRRHPPDAVPAAVDAVRRAGLDLNLDVIYGARGETIDDWRTTLDDVVEFGPDHISAYALTVEAGTPLARTPDRQPDDDDQAAKYDLTADVLEGAGYGWYEISSWARPGKRCRHNERYWTMGEYLAIGCAAHGHRDGVRHWNVATPELYIRAIEAADDPTAGSERLEPEERALEALQLAVRTDRGVPVGSLSDDDRRVLEDLVAPDGDRLVLTRAGRRLANEVATRLRVPNRW